MSMPAETKFPCVHAEEDYMRVTFISSGAVVFEVGYERDDDYGDSSNAALDRAQVESLRDQLTEWLGVGK